MCRSSQIHRRQPEMDPMNTLRTKPHLKLVAANNSRLPELRKELALFSEEKSSTPAFAHLGIYGCYQRQRLDNVTVGGPTVMFIINGIKKLTINNHIYRAAAGEILLLPEGAKFSVENTPDSSKRPYLGLAVRFDRTTIDLFQKIYGDQFENWELSSCWWSKEQENITAALVHWLSWSRQFSPDLMQMRHRQIELLLLFAKQGLAGNLLIYNHMDIQKRVSQLLMLNPARQWKMEEVCSQLATSETTLRRHLRQKNTSFRMLLEEVRLNQGIWLVMESYTPISQIALECGYQSQSRFSERFKLRFNMTPTELRNTQSPHSADTDPPTMLLND